MSDELKLAQRVERSILDRRLFSRREPILVAVSGGLDSMALLHLLAALAKSHGWRITAAHFNHQLRGRSSDADEKLVQRTAKKWKLPFVAGRADVKTFASQEGLSLEMAARKLRHDFLASVALKHGIKKITLAHHADDQVELFFVRLLRGAGGEGLAGMKWKGRSPSKSGIELVRPFLAESKAALVDYVKNHRVPFREDATNAQLDIQRNRIRHELLPLLKKEYQPALGRIILRQMDIIGAETESVTDVARKWLKTFRPAFETLPVAVQRRCIQIQLVEQGISVTSDLIENLRKSKNHKFSIRPDASISRATDGRLNIYNTDTCEFNDRLVSASLSKSRGQKVGRIVVDDIEIGWSIGPMPKGPFRRPKHQVNFECFDADKVSSDMVLRHWRPGDRFQPLGLAQPVKLQDLFINQKIPRHQRHGLLVACTAKGTIFWVEGLRIGEAFKLDKNTRYQLNWRWKRL